MKVFVAISALFALAAARVDVSPIAVGPAIVETPAPIAIGPAIVDFPVVPSPVVIHPNPESVPEYSIPPLVQIILNINQGESTAPVVIPPSVAGTPVEAVDPVIVVDEAEILPSPVIVAPLPVEAVDPVIVVDEAPIVPSPVIVAPLPVDPVIVVDEAPIVPDPVVIGTPELPVVIPEPVITLPEILN